MPAACRRSSSAASSPGAIADQDRRGDRAGRGIDRTDPTIDDVAYVGAAGRRLAPRSKCRERSTLTSAPLLTAADENQSATRGGELLIRHAVVQIPRRPAHACGHRDAAPGAPLIGARGRRAARSRVSHASPRDRVADAVDAEWSTRRSMPRGVAVCRGVRSQPAFELDGRAMLDQCGERRAAGRALRRGRQRPRVDQHAGRATVASSCPSALARQATKVAMVRATDTAKPSARREVDVQAERGARRDGGTDPDRQRGACRSACKKAISANCSRMRSVARRTGRICHARGLIPAENFVPLGDCPRSAARGGQSRSTRSSCRRSSPAGRGRRAPSDAARGWRRRRRTRRSAS